MRFWPFRRPKPNDQARMIACRILWELNARKIALVASDPHTDPKEVLIGICRRLDLRIPDRLPYV